MPTAVRPSPFPVVDPAQRPDLGLRLDLAIRGTTREVRASGRLVAGGGATHPMWMAIAREVGRDLVLDLSGVSAIDAAGVGRLLHTHDRLKARGARMTISAASPRVRLMLDLVGVAPALLAADRARGAGSCLVAVPPPALCGCGR